MKNEGPNEEYFREALYFFQKFQWLFKEPVTKILHDGVLNKFPGEWLNVLQNLENDDLNELVVNLKIQTSWPESLIRFVDTCRELDKLNGISRIKPLIELPKEFTRNLNPKKQHEILNLAQLIHDNCQERGLRTIVDFGSGLGYICQLLYSLYGYKVLGFESKEENVKTAKKRQKTTFPDSLEFVKYIHLDINSNSLEMIQKFCEEEEICVVGLHSCGELSVHMLNMFTELKVAKLLIVLPCCYHKLEVKIDSEKEYFINFPLSTALKKIISIESIDSGDFLKRTFLRLACQETADRWNFMEEEAHTSHSFHVLARAVLEIYCSENGFQLIKNVRKATRKSQCSNFASYLMDCTHRYTLHKAEWNEKIQNEITSLWLENELKSKEVELYTALQLLLQKPVESFVLMDRIQFLKEKNFETFVVQVTERSLSPRSYALISKKNPN